MEGTEVQRRRDAVVRGVLQTARRLLGVELVALNRVDEEDLLVARTVGSLPGLEPGAQAALQTTPCLQMLQGAAAATHTGVAGPGYSAASVLADLGVQTYVGVPVRDPQDEVVGTLCGFDRQSKPVSERAVEVLHGLSRTMTAAGVGRADLDLVLAKSTTGWRFQGLSPADQGVALAAVLAPGSVPMAGEERERLVRAVRSLEHALDDRVLVDQALGRLAERHEETVLEAFRRLHAQGSPEPLPAVAERVVRG